MSEQSKFATDALKYYALFMKANKQKRKYKQMLRKRTEAVVRGCGCSAGAEYETQEEFEIKVKKAMEAYDNGK